MGGRLHEVVCKYREQAVICLALADSYGKKANCEKCGFCPDVEQRRKEAIRAARLIEQNNAGGTR